MVFDDKRELRDPLCRPFWQCNARVFFLLLLNPTLGSHVDLSPAASSFQTWQGAGSVWPRPWANSKSDLVTFCAAI